MKFQTAKPVENRWCLATIHDIFVTGQNNTLIVKFRIEDSAVFASKLFSQPIPLGQINELVTALDMSPFEDGEIDIPIKDELKDPAYSKWNGIVEVFVKKNGEYYNVTNIRKLNEEYQMNQHNNTPFSPEESIPENSRGY
jgi:hypothetical protein